MSDSNKNSKRNIIVQYLNKVCRGGGREDINKNSDLMVVLLHG